MDTFTIKWISWGRSKKAHAQVQNKEKQSYITICGMGFGEYKESTKPHCVICTREIEEHLSEGWTVIETSRHVNTKRRVK